MVVLGWIVAGLATIGAGATVYVIVGKNKAETARIEAILAEQKRVFEYLRSLGAQGTETAAEELIAFAEANESTWGESTNAGDIKGLQAKAKNLLEKERQRRDLLDSMATVETGLTEIAKRTPDELAELRLKLSEIEQRAESMGAEFLARTGKARTDLDRAYASVLREDARSYAAANPDKRGPALQRFTRAEDEIITLYEAAAKAKNKDNTAYFEGVYREIITESNTLVEATYPSESLEKLPWKDLLTGEQVAFWNAAEAQGFSHRLEDGVLSLVGPDAEAGRLGLISIGDREQWRDFVIDMQFTLESGKFDMVFRLGNTLNANTPSVSIEVEQEGIVAGKTYDLTAKMIGSTLELTFYPEDVQYEPQELNWVKTRRGALGFQLHDGTRLKITRLRVQELRASTK